MEIISQSFDDPTTPSAEDDYDLFSLLVNYDLGSISLSQLNQLSGFG